MPHGNIRRHKLTMKIINQTVLTFTKTMPKKFYVFSFLFFIALFLVLRMPIFTFMQNLTFKKI